MTLHQAMAFAILLGTVGLFAWDKLRYDLVAMVSLSVGVALLVSGVVRLLLEGARLAGA